MLIMDYAEGGDLHNYLQKNFINITWIDKINILNDISSGLHGIHRNNFIHRDFHSGNILLSLWNIDYLDDWRIGDLGLSQPANNTLSSNETYGVIPYIAPEIFKGGTFSKETDVYSFGMIMWELTTGCKPFANVEHDIHLIYKILDGKRPEITNDTPECFANLMIRCWDSNPSKRPTIDEIYGSAIDWKYMCSYFYDMPLLFEIIEEFQQAEETRLELTQLKKLGPEFSEQSHQKAIYTSRALSSFISKPINLSSMTSSNMKQGILYYN
ncbi:kinase-like domain-containing protein [Rhizophagus irregularis DAOM 181602=DAOM 197198]|uniref:Kinase-like domain-containing protein n=1 Tax=Rhizophagus irregularis (strain DAOM 181602 / DAOM 197198 / MUCL 43194) TaxID=747089 RepID=A0A2P4PP66_RHIID|nr:kinase-like domain-containing protein [Rhizophagus irregularis DAOM 181602=DAOM 197198]POG67175.1 kinase-like domain-containing protein [Rhizophagus irregularis DAOM 181602=DAOM 197198]|eukprot:XP_025174041.1 kinase-like domain-containing protein [Rhizophagus irregularis DAOM 181602=DAOM 197198]